MSGVVVSDVVVLEQTASEGFEAKAPVRFVVPTDADSLADALIAGQLSPRTRRAYAADLAELLAVLETWNLESISKLDFAPFAEIENLQESGF